MLSQALSNMVTGNDALVENLWTTYLNLPEEQLVLTFVHSVATVLSQAEYSEEAFSV